MTATSGVYARILRRETHAARTVPAVIVAGILILLVLSLTAVGIWCAVDPAARNTLADIARRDSVTALGAAAGSVILLVSAAVLIVAGVAPGHRKRRARVAGRFGLVVDDGVLADAVAGRIARACGIPRARVVVTMQRRRVGVRMTPTSGVPLSGEDARDAVREVLRETGFESAVRVSVARRGVVS